jgi:hypothetical protein
VVDVILHCRELDPEATSNLLVRETFVDEPQDLALSLSEAGGGPYRFSLGGETRKPLEEECRDARGARELSVVYARDRGSQFLDARLVRNVTRCAGLTAPNCVILFVDNGKSHDFGAWSSPEERLDERGYSCRDSLEQDNVGSCLTQVVKRGLVYWRGANDL